MKKGQVNAILVDQVKIKRKIFRFVCIITILTFLFGSFLVLFTIKNKTYYVSYKEKSNLDYNVYLKPNDFFSTKYLGKDNQYIASLIDYINANFDYDLEVDNNDINYQYSYRIEADLNVFENNSEKSLYKHKKVLEEEKLVNPSENSKVKISKDLKIDYNYYNNLVTKFVSAYDLENITSTLDINMYVSIISNCEDVNSGDNESVISLSIPLTTKTVDIDISYKMLDDYSEKIMLCKNTEENNIWIFIGILFWGILDTYFIIRLIKYIFQTRTAQSIYDKKLKKILNNYKSYIQKVNNNFDIRGYQVLIVDTFDDMLEIRDTTCEPILMVENKEKNAVYFFIPSKTKILYSYGLRVKDIKAKKRVESYEKNKKNK